jgi:predicted MPP superfamily phosphohydrolase
LEYDLLIHTGDFLHEDSGLPNVLTLLDALPTPRLGGYAVFGNHDYSIYSHDQFLPRAWAKFQEIHRAQYPISEMLNGNGSAPHDATHHEADRADHNDAVYNTVGSAVGSGRKYTRGRVTPLTHARTLYQFGHYFVNMPLDFKRIGHNNVSALESELAARNIQTLHNRYVHLNHADLGLDIYVAGVDDVVEGTPQLRHALGEIPYDAPTILLSHNPDILLEPGVEQADLILSGHTHGGQIVLPLLGAVHTQSLHLGRKEVSGYLCRGKTQVYITRGVGEGIPLRFGAAPQVTLITILPTP